VPIISLRLDEAEVEALETLVKRGRFASRTAVVSDALRLLFERHCIRIETAFDRLWHPKVRRKRRDCGKGADR